MRRSVRGRLGHIRCDYGMEEYRKILAYNLRKARNARGLSQEAFALESNIDRTYISGIERGRRNPSLDMLVKIAKHLDLPPATLLTPSQQRDEPSTEKGSRAGR
ncbi:helix-turn-helix domain-containing protein [Neorhizobium sp. DT-125]|uniref:helix-turn-helix domain-containing protein n=1 Tax=Neorhizobium sp. DT-125 TaxID=3396163 RepID=UPI003F1C5E0D